MDAAAVKGLSNPEGANHCFLNVVIQSLWHIEPFRRAILAIGKHEHSAAHPGVRFMSSVTPVPPTSAMLGADAIDMSDAGAAQVLRSAASGVPSHSSTPPCCTCALNELYSRYMYEEADHLDPDAVRDTLAVVYAPLNRFSSGRMEDACETFSAVLTLIHAENVQPVGATAASPPARGMSEWDNILCRPPCAAHATFSLQYQPVHVCSVCSFQQAADAVQDYSFGTYVHTLCTSTEQLGSLMESLEAGRDSRAGSSVAVAAALHGSGDVDVLLAVREVVRAGGRLPLGTLISHALCTSELTPEAISAVQHAAASRGHACERPSWYYKLRLQRAPHAFVLSLQWPSASATKDTIAAFFAEQLSDDLSLAHFFRLPYSAAGLPSAPSTYTLRGIVCYYGLHYACFMKQAGTGAWMYLNDRRVEQLPSRAAMVACCIESRYQPVMLIFEATVADKVASCAPPHPSLLPQRSAAPAGQVQHTLSPAPPLRLHSTPAASDARSAGVQHAPRQVSPDLRTATSYHEPTWM